MYYYLDTTLTLTNIIELKSKMKKGSQVMLLRMKITEIVL